MSVSTTTIEVEKTRGNREEKKKRKKRAGDEASHLIIIMSYFQYISC
jgi:hypothetical protein